MRLNVKTLSDWFGGKSVPADRAAVRFLVELLQPKAVQKHGYRPHALDWWLRLHQRAQEQKRAGRRGRRRTRTTDTPPAVVM